MKKIIAFLTALFLAAAGMSGCAEKSLLSSKEPVTLTMWHVYGEQADAPMNLLIEEFNATVGQEKGVLISVTNVTSTSKIGNLLLDAQADKPGVGEMPDLFSCHTTTAVMLGSENLVDWKDQFNEKELESYLPEFLKDGEMDGRLAVFPVSKSTYALFINGTQFDRFSADTGYTEADLENWEGFFAAADAYYDWSNGKPFCAFDYLIRHIELDMLAKGHDFDYTENGWYNMEDPILKDSWLKFARPLASGHIAVADLYANTQVMTGEALAGIGSTAAIGYYNEVVTYPDNTTDPMDLRVLPLPKTGDGEQFMPQTGVGLAAYKTTDQKAEAAAVFIRWFTEGERNLDFVAETGYMPVSTDAFEAIKDYTFKDAGYESLYNAIGIMQENYTPVVRPDFDGFYDRTNQLYDSLRECQTDLAARADAGEDIDALAEETWELFASID